MSFGLRSMLEKIKTAISSLFEKVSHKANACRPSMASAEMEFLPASLEVVESPHRLSVVP